MTRRLRFGLIVGGAAGALLVAVMIVRGNGPNRTAAPSGIPGSVQAAAPGGVPVVDVGLERLSQSPPGPPGLERNLFRFRVAAVPEWDPDAATSGPAPTPRISAGTGPPPLEPIPLRYIGLLEAPSQAGRVGIFSDGRGNVFYAREGDIIEGRYPTIQIGPVSAELSHLDGSGRQTIRLSGQ